MICGSKSLTPNGRCILGEALKVGTHDIWARELHARWQIYAREVGIHMTCRSVSFTLMPNTFSVLIWYVVFHTGYSIYMYVYHWESLLN